jgi:hypothetical protein
MKATRQDEKKLDPILPSAAAIPTLSPVQSSRCMSGNVDVEPWFRRLFP